MPIKKHISNYLLLLTILCLIIGTYKLITLACVSKDTVTFMQFAETLKTSPRAAVQSYDQHPGYPILILTGEWVSKKIGFGSTLQQQIYIAQSIALLCRTVTICLLFMIFYMFTHKKIAFWSTLLLMLVPAYANLGSEALSDWPGMMWMTFALYFSLLGIKTMNPLYYLAAGLASGLGYWIRPEEATIVAVMGLYTLIYLFKNKKYKFQICICCGVMVISAAFITLPYMVYKGALFPKKKIGTFSSAHVGSIDRVSEANAAFQCKFNAAALPIEPVRAIWEFTEETINVLLLLSIPLLWMMIYKMSHFRQLRSREQFICLFNGLWLTLMIWLYCSHGYISNRHIMPLVAFNFIWIIKGLHKTALFLDRKKGHLQRNTAILMGICIVLFIPKLIRPAHADKSAWRDAGLWLRENTPPDAALAVFDPRIGFYAERSYSILDRKLSSETDFLAVKTTDDSVTLPKSAVPVATFDNITQIYQIRP